MKKILSLLSTLTVVINTGTSVIACNSSKNNNNGSNMSLNKLSSEFKNNNLTISNDWNNFWGNLKDKFQNKTYYQLLMDQIFDQNKIQYKYEQDIQLLQKVPDGNYVKAKNLSKINLKNDKSETVLGIQVSWNGVQLSNLIPLHVKWSLTPDQSEIYTLINELQMKNQLNIYDNWGGFYINNQVQIKSYNQSLKNAFNKQYNLGNNNYQYTNFTDSPLKNNYLHTDGTANYINLIITNKKASYKVPDFTIYFNSIGSLFNLITKSYDSGFVLWYDWEKPDASKIPSHEILQQLEEGVPGLDDLENYANQITFKGTLPTSDAPGIKTIQIIYNHEIFANIKTGYL